MKVCMFHLMPYRDLPADFEKQFDSVWITPPTDLLCDPEKVSQYYNWTLDELEYASEMGLDGICVNEHHQNAYGFMPAPNLMAAALARRTKDTALVVLGNTLPLYSPPIRVAEEFAMLDTISGGRLVAGFPVGSAFDVNYCYGIVPEETRPRFYEANSLIRQAWTRPGPWSFNGEFTQLRYVNPWPKPLQKPHPPVWLAGGGSLETWDFAVEQDYTYNLLSFSGFMAAEKGTNGYWNRLRELGVDNNPYRFGFIQSILVSETDEQAEKDYAQHAQYFYDKCLHIPAHFADPPGYRTPNTVSHQLKAGDAASAAAARTTGNNWQGFLESGKIIAGSPETVRTKLREACKSLRIGHLMALLHLGSMPTELTKKNIRLFATEVLPYVRDLWDDEWEDHWWPQRAKARVPAAK